MCETITKYVDSKLCIEWTEEPIEKSNKPPCDEERHSNRKNNHTAKEKKRILGRDN
jgi:hypothetical protein